MRDLPDLKLPSVGEDVVEVGAPHDPELAANYEAMRRMGQRAAEEQRRRRMLVADVSCSTTMMQAPLETYRGRLTTLTQQMGGLPPLGGMGMVPPPPHRRFWPHRRF